MFKRFTAALAVACLLFAGCSSTSNTTAKTEEAAELSDAVLNSFVNTNDEEITLCYRGADGKMTQPVAVSGSDVLVEGVDQLKSVIASEECTEIDKNEFNEDELIALVQMPDKHMLYFYNGGLIKTVHGTDRMFYSIAGDDPATAIATFITDYTASLPQ